MTSSSVSTLSRLLVPPATVRGSDSFGLVFALWALGFGRGHVPGNFEFSVFVVCVIRCVGMLRVLAKQQAVSKQDPETQLSAVQ